METQRTNKTAAVRADPRQAVAEPGGRLQDTPGAALADTSAAGLTLRHHQHLANGLARSLQLRRQTEQMGASPAAMALQGAQQLANGGSQALQFQQREEMMRCAPVQREEKPNNTGLPDQLKVGVESLSGMRLDHVKVHYNSDKPALLQAHAYAQGSEIHVAPGQERHLPHEAWHVVQQAQGRVPPTAMLKAGVPVNDDRGLEAEADAMGAKALHGTVPLPVQAAHQWIGQAAQTRSVVQRALNMVYGGGATLSPASVQKLSAVRVTVDGMGVAIVPEIDLNLTITQDPDHLETNPADTTLHPPGMHLGQPYHTIDMTIRSWFIDISTVGEIIGMICHELGVHSLADIEMTAAERGNETAQAGVPTAAFIGGRHLPLAPMVLDAQGNIQAADRRQKDHVNVAKFAAAPAPALQPMPRMQTYINTMLRLGDAIHAAPILTDVAKHKAQTELFQTLLFDLGRIVATDDGSAWAVARGAGNIAVVFNALRNHLVAQYSGAHPWMANLHVEDATASGLIGMLAGKVARALWVQRGAMARQASHTAIAGVGGVLAGVANAGRRVLGI